MITPFWPPHLESIWHRSQHRSQTAPKPSLDTDRICFRALLVDLVPKTPTVNITITGTNGKGATAAMLEAVLLQSGITTGLFTSPHLWNVTERFRVNGEDIDVYELDNVASQIDTMVETFCTHHPTVARPTFFEMLVLIGRVLFSGHHVAATIWEAGIGGGKDCIALLPTTVSALTSVSLDHTRVLGATIEEIAAEKARLAPPGIPMVLGNLARPARLAAAEQLKDRRSPKIDPMFDIVADGPPGPLGQRFRCQDRTFILPLLGGHQADNMAVVRALYETLEPALALPPFDPVHLAHTRWPARTEWIPGTPPFLIDVAHNPEAFTKLIDVVTNFLSFESTIVLYGATLDRDHPRCDHLAARLGADVRFVEGFFRAAPCQQWLTSEVDTRVCYPTPQAAVNHICASHADRAKTVVVAGSVFLAGAVRHYLTTSSAIHGR